MGRRVIAALALSALLAGLTGSAAQIGPREPAEGEALLWGGRVFTEPEAFARWLDARGADYSAWSRRHPVAAARLEGRQVERPAPPRPSPEPAEPKLVGSTVPAAGGVGGRRVVLLGLGALGMVALLTAAVRLRRSDVVHTGPAARLGALGPAELAAVGVSILVGVAIAFFVG